MYISRKNNALALTKRNVGNENHKQKLFLF